MGTLKFTDIELKQLVRKGLSLRAMARHLRVSKSTVCARLKALNIAVSRDVTIRSARKIVDREINALDQLQKINRDANEMLDLCMRWNRGEDDAKAGGQEGEASEYRFRDPRELALKVMAEIRGQLRLQVEIFQALFDMRAVKEFQAEVLEIIENVSPEARNEIVRRLAEKNALRSSLDLDQAPKIVNSE
ncbi:MAG: hypothetical protein ACLQVJ_25590 [Syntrophobacteraceae bacterium]